MINLQNPSVYHTCIFLLFLARLDADKKRTSVFNIFPRRQSSKNSLRHRSSSIDLASVESHKASATKAISQLAIYSSPKLPHNPPQKSNSRGSITSDVCIDMPKVVEETATEDQLHKVQRSWTDPSLKTDLNQVELLKRLHEHKSKLEEKEKTKEVDLGVSEQSIEVSTASVSSHDTFSYENEVDITDEVFPPPNKTEQHQ